MTVATEEAPLPPGPSLVQYEGADGKRYNAKFDPRCHTCQSPYRFDIDKGMASGGHATALAEWVSGLPKGSKDHPSAQSILNHVREHTPIRQMASQAIIDRQMELTNREVGDSVESLIDGITFAKLVVQRAAEGLAEDKEVSVQEGLAAAALVKKFEDDMGQGINEMIWRDALYAYMDVIFPEIPHDRREAVTRALENHPTMKALMEERRKAEGTDIVRGEVL
jgi:hypothetical protein